MDFCCSSSPSNWSTMPSNCKDTLCNTFVCLTDTILLVNHLFRQCHVYYSSVVWYCGGHLPFAVFPPWEFHACPWPCCDLFLIVFVCLCSLLQVTCPVLGNITQLSSPEKAQSLFTFNERPNLKETVLSFCLDLLLMPYRHANHDRQIWLRLFIVCVSSLSALGRRPMSAPSGGVDRENAGVEAPPGLSPAAVKRVTGNSPINSSELEMVCQVACHFVSQWLFVYNWVVWCRQSWVFWNFFPLTYFKMQKLSFTS